MRNMYEYYSRGGGHNLAWASAVKSKPSDLPKPSDEIVGIEIPKTMAEVSNLKVDTTPENSCPVTVGGCLKQDGSPENRGTSNIDSSMKIDPLLENCVLQDKSVEDCRGGNKVANPVIEIDEEKIKVMEKKEEVELEEGEIDFDSDAVYPVENEFHILEIKAADLEQKSNSILKGLENVDVECGEKSFKEVYSLMEDLLENLHELADQISLTKKDDLIELLFTAIKSLQIVFPSMSENQKEQMGENMKRFVASLMARKHSALSTEQLKEMDVLFSAMHSSTVYTDAKAIEMNNEKTGVDIHSEYSNLDSIYDPDVNTIPMEISSESEANEPFESCGVVEVSSKYKGLSLPLLDLHMDHDADSLPSPTQDAPYILPISKALGIGGEKLKPEWPSVPRISVEPNVVALHPLGSDAIKHSTYQQKFNRSSFSMNDELPSPTPSEDGDTANGGDINGDISSSLKNVYAFSTSAPEPPRSSLPTKVDLHSEQVLQSSWCSFPVSLGQNLKPKPSTTRNRDPRLRFVSSDVAKCETLSSNEPKGEPGLALLGSRKQKTIEEPIVSQPALKKLKHESRVVHNRQNVTGASGWRNDGGTAFPENGNDPRKPGNTMGVGNSGTITPNVTVNDNLSPLNSLLHEFFVNPSVLMDLYKMEQRKSAKLTKSTTQLPSLNMALGSVPLMSSITPLPTLVTKGSSGTSQVVTHTTPAAESGINRMKPRDPRRVLHSNNTLQRGDDQSLGKTSTPSVPGREQRHEDQPEKNLQNIADIVSVSQSNLSHVPASQQAPAQSNLQNIADIVSVSQSNLSPSQPCENNWGDVEHLFDGFDEQQKAAIKRDRARRMEEQRKMFASRKLCLVLDLDHTLLNSAKFDEVEPQHQEMLRKWEEEDRGNQQRNLFRFPHMQMWTKLRPGIWKFLETATKLYELHLYTMGNKIYATEMAKLLDPKGELFAGRVISRGDDADPVDGDERAPRSKDLEGVLGMESAVVIIDDSIRVWPHNKLNLIVVERYLYFPCSRRQFGLPGPSLLEYGHDERLEDGTLASTLSVIERIHSNFFSHQSLHEVDVRNILALEQRKILAGCRILFSRIFPVEETKPHLHPLWQTAEQFGAVCTNSIDDQVTHVVAYSLGTDKVNWALSHGRFVVRPGWVEASALLYRRANEYDHIVKP